MPTPVNKQLQGDTDIAAAIRTLQTYLGQTVKLVIDDQALSGEIIKLQTYLQTQGKFSAGNINRYIDNEMLGAKVIELQVAANLP